MSVEAVGLRDRLPLLVAAVAIHGLTCVVATLIAKDLRRESLAAASDVTPVTPSCLASGGLRMFFFAKVGHGFYRDITLTADQQQHISSKILPNMGEKLKPCPQTAFLWRFLRDLSCYLRTFVGRRLALGDFARAKATSIQLPG